jgi:hypothetical protein
VKNLVAVNRVLLEVQAASGFGPGRGGYLGGKRGKVEKAKRIFGVFRRAGIARRTYPKFS